MGDKLKFFILTDLEGASGVDSFQQTRVEGELKDAAMELLTDEVNACVRGIRSMHPDAEIDVWDGHGSGGLNPNRLVNARYLKGGNPYFHLDGYTAMLFVGQHAMAGTMNAPLCHTYSSLHVAYYRLNGVFIGEYAARALVAGRQGVPTIFLAGDDKAVHEVKLFTPSIETVVTKMGRGWERAVHVGVPEVHAAIYDGARGALLSRRDIAPFTEIAPPYTLEIRYNEPLDSKRFDGSSVRCIDSRTVQFTSGDLSNFPI